MPGIAIVAALEREIRPLVKHWRVVHKSHGGREFKFYESENVTAVCGGIGAAAARRAAEAAIASYSPEVIYSVGFAGALPREKKVADIVTPRRVVNTSDGSSIDTGIGDGTLVSFSSVASATQKAKLRESYAAQAVDMEAAAVAQAAQARGIGFAAVKAISDEADFALPNTERFVTADGRFREGSFAMHVILRPWLWSSVAKLARNSARASEALCASLHQIICTYKSVPSAIPQGALQR